MLFAVTLNLIISGFLIFSIRKFVLTFYLVVNYILLVQPMVIKLLFGVVHPQHNFFNTGTYETALIYIAIFNLILGISFVFCAKSIPVSLRLRRYFSFNRIDHGAKYRNIFIASIVLLIIALVGKFTLEGMGGFRMLKAVTPSVFLQLYKLFSTFDLFLLIFVGEFKINTVKNKKKFDLLYFLIAAVSIGLASVSGSRSQIVIVFLIMMISHRKFVRNHIVLVGTAAVTILPTVFILFPVIADYRNSNYQLVVALESLENNLINTSRNMFDILTTRLNYIEAFAKVIDYVDSFGPAGGAVYWNNLLGLIPRLLWPGKPLISNDSQELGHLLGIVTANDTTTSIGLRVIGEAYYELAWFGLLVAVVQGLLFAILQKQFDHKSSAVLSTIYIYTTIYLMSRDGYFAVVPGLVTLAIGWFIFFGIITYYIPRYRPQNRKPNYNARMINRLSSN